MPKRQNPFGESSPLQVKAHIGTKEVDMGVNRDKNMTSVYERTKSLLYEGAKKMSPVKIIEREEGKPMLKPLAGQCRLVFKSHNNSDSGCGGPMEVTLERPSDQSTPDENGNCSAAGNHMPVDNDVQMETASTIAHLPKGQMQIDCTGHLQVCKATCTASFTSFKLCNSCLRPSQHGMKTCDFCDRNTCVNCITQCHSCHGYFCQVCSVINYDACLERPFCLQCSS